MILVKNFTTEIIDEIVKAYTQEDDGYWLKFYHFAGDIDTTVFDQLKAEHIKEHKRIEAFHKLDPIEQQKLLDEELDDSQDS